MNAQLLFFCYNGASFQDSLLKLLGGETSFEAADFLMKTETTSCNASMRIASPSVGGKVLLLCLWEQLVCCYLHTYRCHSEAIADLGVLKLLHKITEWLCLEGTLKNI